MPISFEQAKSIIEAKYPTYFSANPGRAETFEKDLNYANQYPANMGNLVDGMVLPLIKDYIGNTGGASVKYNGKTYKVKIGSRGGKYIQVGKDKRHVYL